MHWLVAVDLAVFGVTYGLFAWAYHARFRRVTTREPVGAVAAKVGGFVTMLVVVGGLVRVTSPAWPLSVAAGLAGVVALALFMWTLSVNTARPLSLVYSPDAPLHLADQGPYALVRHPFYASYLLAYYAGVAASQQWWALVCPLVMTAVYVDAASREERKFLASPLRARYLAYSLEVGRFWPRLGCGALACAFRRYLVLPGFMTGCSGRDVVSLSQASRRRTPSTRASTRRGRRACSDAVTAGLHRGRVH